MARLFLWLLPWVCHGQTQKEINKALATLPLAREILMGKKVSQITSCSVLDGITWKFRPDGRRSRVLIRDTFRMNSAFEFFTWEISQVMDTDGFTTFIFRRALKKNKTEAFAVRDYLYNKIIEIDNRTQVVESKSIRNLIGTPAYVFTTANGASVTYYPGAYKSSYLMISHPTEAGVLSNAPVFIKSTICYRSEEQYEGLKVSKETQEKESTARPGTGSAGTSTAPATVKK